MTNKIGFRKLEQCSQFIDLILIEMLGLIKFKTTTQRASNAFLFAA